MYMLRAYQSPVFGHALRAPVRPDAELGIAIPVGSFVLLERIPCGFVRSLASQSLDRRDHRRAVPGAPRDWKIRRHGRAGLGIGAYIPGGFVELRLPKPSLFQNVEHALVRRRGAELDVVLRIRFKIAQCIRSSCRRLLCCGWQSQRSYGRGGQFAKIPPSHRAFSPRLMSSAHPAIHLSIFIRV